MTAYLSAAGSRSAASPRAPGGAGCGLEGRVQQHYVSALLWVAAVLFVGLGTSLIADGRGIGSARAFLIVGATYVFVLAVRRLAGGADRTVTAPYRRPPGAGPTLEAEVRSDGARRGGELAARGGPGGRDPGRRTDRAGDAAAARLTMR